MPAIFRARYSCLTWSIVQCARESGLTCFNAGQWQKRAINCVYNKHVSVGQPFQYRAMGIIYWDSMPLFWHSQFSHLSKVNMHTPQGCFHNRGGSDVYVRSGKCRSPVWRSLPTSSSLCGPTTGSNHRFQIMSLVYHLPSNTWYNWRTHFAGEDLWMKSFYRDSLFYFGIRHAEFQWLIIGSSSCTGLL